MCKVSEGKLCTGVTSVVTLFFLSILMHFLRASCYKSTSREMPYVLFFLSSKLALMFNQHQGIRHRILFCKTSYQERAQLMSTVDLDIRPKYNSTSAKWASSADHIYL